MALLHDEPPARRVEELIAEPACAASWINLGEVAYIEARRVGEDAARDAVIRVSEQLIAVPVDPALVLSAASVKASGGLSYAGAFAVATAESRGARLATGDTELLCLDRRSLELVDLRK